MDLIQFQQNLIDIDVWLLLTPILEKKLDNIEEMNRVQMSEGLNALGTDIGKYRSNKWTRYKTTLPTYKVSPGQADLRDTGDFYRGITAFLEDSGITFDSNDDKALEIETKYGSRIYGLTPENLTKLTKSCVDELRKSILTAMFKN